MWNTRSKISARKHTPITSAAMAAPTPKGTATLLIVTHLSLSTPVFLELPPRSLSTAFHVSVSLLLSTTIFLCPSCVSRGRQSSRWDLRFSFSTMSTMFFGLGQIFLCTSTQKNTGHCHLTVSTRLHWRVGGFIRGPQRSWCFVVYFSFSRICSMYRLEFHTIKGESNDFSCLRVLDNLSLPADSVANLSQTYPRLCHLHLCFHLV